MEELERELKKQGEPYCCGNCGSYCELEDCLFDGFCPLCRWGRFGENPELITIEDAKRRGRP